MNNVDTLFNFGLPTEYISFVNKTNGGVAKKEIIQLENNIEVMINVFFGVNENRAFDLRYINEEYKSDIPPKSLLIANDPGGAFYLLHKVNDWNVYYYDHEYNFTESSDDCNTYRVKMDIKSFLSLLETPFLAASSDAEKQRE